MKVTYVLCDRCGERAPALEGRGPFALPEGWGAFILCGEDVLPAVPPGAEQHVCPRCRTALRDLWMTEVHARSVAVAAGLLRTGES
jgi:hypothetical protein